METRGATTMSRTGMSGRRKAVWGAAVTLGVTLAALSLAGCGDQVLENESSSYIIVDSLEAASGAEPDEFGTILHSDVITLVKCTDPVTGEEGFCATTFSDAARVALRLVMKDPGTAGSPTTPTPNNFVTITRYRVEFTRSDGRNTPGVDVPHPFDAQMTVTVGRDVVDAGFLLIRHTMKLEAPLLAIANGGGLGMITTNARVTFFGHDQTGREVNTVAQMSVIFGNFGDPSS
jgi:hypothetical protein